MFGLEDMEVRFSIGTGLLVLSWVAAVALIGVAVWLNQPWAAVTGLFGGQVGAVLAIIRDNNKTRRTTRQLMLREQLVQDIRGGVR